MNYLDISNSSLKRATPSLLATICVLLIYCFFAMGGKWEFKSSKIPNHYYAHLVSAFESGHTYLPIPPDPRLMNLSNPYDPYARDGIPLFWDASLYNGKYFLYFTPIPALLVYWPYYKITQSYLPAWVGALSFSLVYFFTVISSFKVISEKFPTINQIFPRPFWILILGLCNPVLYSLAAPEIYQTAVLCGLAFCTLGLHQLLLWHLRMKYVHIFLSGIFLSLAIVSRPSLTPIIGLVLLLLVFHSTRQKAALPKLLTYLILGLVPFLALQGFYNYIRFDNILEFGVRYQIGLFDFSSKSFCRIPTNLSELIIFDNALSTYFFQPPLFASTFPYIRYEIAPKSSLSCNFETIDGMVGAIYSITILWLLPIIPFVSSKITFANFRSEPHLKTYTCILFFSGCAVCAILSTCGFIVQRYLLDATPFFTLGTILIASQFLVSVESGQLRKSFLQFIVLLMILIFSILPSFSGSQNYFEKKRNPYLIRKLRKELPVIKSNYL